MGIYEWRDKNVPPIVIGEITIPEYNLCDIKNLRRWEEIVRENSRTKGIKG